VSYRCGDWRWLAPVTRYWVAGAAFNYQFEYAPARNV
jgi:hypothetical protein